MGGIPPDFFRWRPVLFSLVVRLEREVHRWIRLTVRSPLASSSMVPGHMHAI